MSAKPEAKRDNGLYKAKLYNPRTDYKEFKPKLYEQPPYKDPLREQPREYKGNFKVPEYKAFVAKPFHHEYREYKGPFIDPITKKPYKRGQKQKKVEEEVETVPHATEETEPIPKVYIPYKFGDTTGSTKRSFRIFDGYDF